MSSSEDIDNPAGVSSSISDSEDDVWTEEPRVKRFCDKSKWGKSIAKKKRDSGEAYIGVKTKRPVAARRLGAPCTCPLKCYNVLGQGIPQLIFDQYYKLASHNAQTSYLVSRVQSSPVKRSYAGANSKRTVTCEYSVEINGQKTVVCKTAFLNMHAISSKRVFNV